MLKDPAIRMHEIEVSLFSPFRPMLGDRGKPSQVKINEQIFGNIKIAEHWFEINIFSQIEKVMDGKPYIIETKFDGERMQLHKKDDEYKFFSRG